MDINMLSVIFQAFGFSHADSAQPPVPAPNTRDADLVIANLVISNQTDEIVHLTFQKGVRFRIELVRLDVDEIIWSDIDDQAEDDLVVEIPVGEVWGVPPTTDQDGGNGEDAASHHQDIPDDAEGKVPEIPLKEIIEERRIPKDVELAVRFFLLAQGLPTEVKMQLWRDSERT